MVFGPFPRQKRRVGLPTIAGDGDLGGDERMLQPSLVKSELFQKLDDGYLKNDC
jgi:hypothetical protein